MTSRQYAVILDEIKLSNELQAVYDKYLEFKEKNAVQENHLRTEDFRRWELTSRIANHANSFLDVGAGVGQFSNLMSAKLGKSVVSACDIEKHFEMQNYSGFEYFEHDMTLPLPRSYDVISCLEAIEHIDDSGFMSAVVNLKNATKSQLLISVPYCEPEPLGPGHFQRFDRARLDSLFPDADYYFCLKGRVCQWVLLNWSPKKHS